LPSHARFRILLLPSQNQGIFMRQFAVPLAETIPVMTASDSLAADAHGDTAAR
jgi:hypothetical protein